MIKNSTTIQETFLTPIEASNFLNISVSTLKKLIYQGRVRTLRTPGGHHRIPKSSLLSLVERNPVTPEVELANGFKSAYQILEPMVSAFELNVNFHHGHALLVAERSCEIARKLRFTADRLRKLQIAALLHDIGLIRIDTGILNKHYPLTQEEYERVKSHPIEGEGIVRSMKSLNGIATVIRQHHERFDGAGYPDGLKGEEIELDSRIIHLAEAFTSMTSTHSYKDAHSEQDALNIIADNSGTQFDPKLVKVFLQLYGR